MWTLIHAVVIALVFLALVWVLRAQIFRVVRVLGTVRIAFFGGEGSVV
jgi:hypothetical protein